MLLHAVTRGHTRSRTILLNPFLPRTSHAHALARSLAGSLVCSCSHVLIHFVITSAGYIYDNLVPRYHCVFCGRGRSGLRIIFITDYVLLLLLSQGCLSELKQFVDDHLIILGIVAVSIAGIQVCNEL